MKFFPFIVVSFIGFTFTASASPSEDVVAMMNHSYNPKIEIKDSFDGWSFYGCSLRDIEIFGQDPVNLNKRKISVTYYRGKTPNTKNSAIILLPPTGGVNILDRGYANELCRAGFDVALISTWENKEPQNLGFEIHDQGALRSLAAIRHVVEFLSKQGTKSIGLLGTSIGAISGNLALGFESRISTAALIVGSGRFADVIAESTEEGATRLRTHRMKEAHISNLEDYRKLVHSFVKTDPSSFINYSGPKKVLLVTADQDTTVPTPYQDELVDLMKPQVHLALKGNHIDVIKATFFQKRSEIVDFFKRNL